MKSGKNFPGDSIEKRSPLAPALFAVVILGMVSASNAQTVVYQDSFDNDTLAVNTGTGGGAANRSFGGHFWSDDGDLNFNRAGGGNFQLSALAYSMNTFQSNNGFELSVDYTDNSFGAAARRLAFGLVSDSTNLGTYTPDNVNNRNPFSDSNLYSFGLTVREGLRFSDGTTVTLLHANDVQTGSSAFFSLLDDGVGGANWSYAIDGASQSSGNIAVFDFSSGYQFAAYGQDNEGARSIQAVTLATIDPVGNPVIDPGIAPVIDPILTLVDIGAIAQLSASAIPMNISIGQVASQVHGTGLRDLNGRLARLRGMVGSGGFLQERTAGRGREISATRNFHLERKMKIQSTIRSGSAAGSATPDGAQYESAILDDRNPLVPSVTLQAGGREDSAWQRFETFASFDYGNYDLDPLRQNSGVESHTYAGTAGVEYIVNSNLAAGLAITHVESDNDLSGGLGSVDLIGEAVSGYASFFKNNLWGDLLYSYGDYETDITRNTFLGSMVRARPDVEAHQTSLNLGYNIPHENRFTHGPTFRADYSWGHLDGYTETGDPRANTIFQKQEYESFITTLGWQLNTTHETDWGALLPQVRLGYGRENLDRETNVSGTLQNSPIAFLQGGNLIGTGGAFTNTLNREDPGEGWMEFGAGVGFDFRNNFSVFLDYQGRFFQQDSQQHIATLRGSWKF